MNFMSYEEFKKAWEKFSVLDTEDRIAICRNQYEGHLLHLEDQEYFEPGEKITDNDITSQYNLRLLSILDFDKVTANQIYFLRRPSFEPESSLVIEKIGEKYLMKYSVLDDNYWYVFYKDNTVKTIGKKTLTGALYHQIGDKLFKLLNNTFNVARPSKAKFMVLDGIYYSLTRVVNGEYQTIFKHSPDEDSKSGKIIAVLESLVERLSFQNGKLDSDLELLIDRLLP